MNRIIFLLISLFYFSVAIAQDIKPTATEALLKVSITDANDKARINEIISFKSDKTGNEYKGTTDNLGKFSILVPKGNSYTITNVSLNNVADNQMEIPLVEGLITMNAALQFDTTTTYKTFTLEDVFFDTGKASLKSESHKALNELTELMKAKPSLIIEIGGHTDNIGSPANNLVLSQKRAETARSYLVSKGLSGSRITAKGYGDTRPIAPNNNEEGRKLNRRTEVMIR